MVWPFSGKYGADAKAASNARDAAREEWNQGAQPAYYDETKSDEFKLDLNRRIGALQTRKAPTATAAQYGADAFGKAATVGPVSQINAQSINVSPEMRARQNESLAMLRDQAMGLGPSIAGQQMQQSVDAALAARNRAAAASRINPALANIGANQAASSMLHEGALQSAASKSREVNEGVQRFGQLSAGMRDQDIGEATARAKLAQEAGLFNASGLNAAELANAGFAQQMSGANATAWQKQAQMQQDVELANVEASLRSRGMTDDAIAHYLGAFQRQMHADKAAKQAYWEQSQDNFQFDEKMAYQAQRDAQLSDAQTVSSMAMMIGAASDEKVKTNVKPASKAIRSMLDSLGAHEYEYRDPSMQGAATGRHVSPMAQEIASTTIGRSAVRRGEDGYLRVDYGRLQGAQLAALADMHQRLKKLEGGRGAK
jgi:hypothetical protein